MSLAIELNFGIQQMQGTLHNTPIGQRLYDLLPVSIPLTLWGKEAYGPVYANLPPYQPQETIPGGGIAYSADGDYLCFFWGQNPAWPVDHVGDIHESQWPLLNDISPNQVSISKVTSLKAEF